MIATTDKRCVGGLGEFEAYLLDLCLCWKIPCPTVYELISAAAYTGLRIRAGEDPLEEQGGVHLTTD